LLLPATTHQVAQRVLRNLKAAYARLEDWPHALPVQERLVCLLPKVPEERRDLGLILLRTGQPWPALELLERYSRDCPDASGTIAPFVRAARRLGAEMN
jgi:regulator of sirC expression with transglutaminase-like and TPR domain